MVMRIPLVARSTIEQCPELALEIQILRFLLLYRRRAGLPEGDYVPSGGLYNVDDTLIESSDMPSASEVSKELGVDNSTLTGWIRSGAVRGEMITERVGGRVRKVWHVDREQAEFYHSLSYGEKIKYRQGRLKMSDDEENT